MPNLLKQSLLLIEVCHKAREAGASTEARRLEDGTAVVECRTALEPHTCYEIHIGMDCSISLVYSRGESQVRVAGLKLPPADDQPSRGRVASS